MRLNLHPSSAFVTGEQKAVNSNFAILINALRNRHEFRHICHNFDIKFDTELQVICKHPSSWQLCMKISFEMQKV